MLQHCVTLKIVAANRLVANSPLKKKKGNWVELTFAKTSGAVPWDRGKNWPIADGVSPVMIPETPAGFISAPFSISFIKWRLGVAGAYITDLSQCKLGGSWQNSI